MLSWWHGEWLCVVVFDYLEEGQNLLGFHKNSQTSNAAILTPMKLSPS
jgi:hypothetical protein